MQVMLLRVMTCVLLLLLTPAAQAGSPTPLVMTGGKYPECNGNSCQLKPAFGNGVVIENRGGKELVIATAGHNLHQVQNLQVWSAGAWHSAARSEYVLTEAIDFGVIVVRGDFPNVPAWPVYQGQIPSGAELWVEAYWPAEPNWKTRRLSVRRIVHRMFGDVLDQPITPGVSGGALLYQGQLAGIVVGIDPKGYTPSVTFFTPVEEIRKYLSHWGFESKSPPVSADSQDNSIPPPSGNVTTPPEKLETETENTEPAVHPPQAPPVSSDSALPRPESTPGGADSGGPTAETVVGKLGVWGLVLAGIAIGGPAGALLPYVGGWLLRKRRQRGSDRRIAPGLKPERGGDPISPTTPVGGCEECEGCEERYRELTELVGQLQRQLADAKTSVVTVTSLKASRAYDQALHAVIRLHPDDPNVFRVVQKVRELQKQYYSGVEA